MSSNNATNATTPNRFSTTPVNATVQELAALTVKYPGRTLFATWFSSEDQIVAHLVFGNALPIRVFTRSGADQYDILIRSVDFFKGNIEVSFQQARLAAAEFAERHPEIVREYEKNPATAPLVQVLQGHHLLISSRRKDQLLEKQPNPVQFEWDEAKQRAVFYPLFDWTEKQVQAYIQQHDIPHLPAPLLPASKRASATQPTPSPWRSVWQLLALKHPATEPNLKKAASVIDLFRSHSPKQALLGLME